MVWWFRVGACAGNSQTTQLIVLHCICLGNRRVALLVQLSYSVCVRAASAQQGNDVSMGLVRAVLGFSTGLLVVLVWLAAH